MLQTYEGYFEQGQFIPIGPPVRLKERRRVIVTVLDEVVPEQKETAQAQAWREFFDTVNSSDEEVPETFDRVNFNREIEL